MRYFRVVYRSLTAFYGPAFIAAESEAEARRKFAGMAFASKELPLIEARECSAREIEQALSKSST